jgi:prepilin-type N-terminal cleavage/methylation domain-containing protein
MNRLHPTISSQRGFTLIELLTVISILGVLTALSLRNLTDLKAKAAYAGVSTLVGEVRTGVNAAVLNDPDNPPASVGSVTQTGGGQLSDASARNLLPTIRLASNLSLTIEHDSGCVSSACSADSAVVKHCQGTEYAAWTRFGDGIEVQIDKIPGAGCS